MKREKEFMCFWDENTFETSKEVKKVDGTFFSENNGYQEINSEIKPDI